MCKFYANNAPFYERDFSIHEFSRRFHIASSLSSFIVNYLDMCSMRARPSSDHHSLKRVPSTTEQISSELMTPPTLS